ncbi:MAG: site-2 protease family protein [Candidatus Pacearchaeota archaeon]
MDKIILLDLILLVIFSLAIAIFLYKNRRSLKREGLLFLFKTQLGVSFIERFAKKNEKILRKMGYPIIFLSIILMIIIFSLFLFNAYSYVRFPKEVKEATNGAVPVAPVIPYFPQIFGLDNYFPNFYFIYFIIVFSIVALFHEFSHGIFMKLYNVRIRSTGFLFLGPILGAFVEQDDKQFRKKKNYEQMVVLGAGVFSNFMLAIFFFFILVIFFYTFYNPSGYIISNYAYEFIDGKNISYTENYSEDFLKVITKDNNSYFLPLKVYEKINFSESENLLVFYDSPAFRNNLSGVIREIDGKKIRNFQDFREEILKKNPSQKINITIMNKDGEIKTYEISLSTNPHNSSLGFLGISTPFVSPPKSLFKKAIYYLAFFKNPYTYYESIIDKKITEFFYYFIWWCALINLFVALFNMLPFSIFDGGRFSYLLFLSLFKKESYAKAAYKVISSLVVLSLILIIFSWLISKIVF